MSIVNLPAAILALEGCEVSSTRDGFALRSADRHVVQVCTRFADEGKILAALEAIAHVLRSRGAAGVARDALAELEVRTTGISVDFTPPESEVDALSSAIAKAPAPLPVDKRGKRGGKG